MEKIKINFKISNDKCKSIIECIEQTNKSIEEVKNSNYPESLETASIKILKYVMKMRIDSILRVPERKDLPILKGYAGPMAEPENIKFSKNSATTGDELFKNIQSERIKKKAFRKLVYLVYILKRNCKKLWENPAQK